MSKLPLQLARSLVSRQHSACRCDNHQSIRLSSPLKKRTAEEYGPLVFDEDLMADLPADHPLENLLLASSENLGIDITLELWDDVYEGDYFDLLVNGNQVGGSVDVGNGDTSVTFTLPAPHLEGNYIITYNHYIGGSSNAYPGPMQRYSVILTPPGGLAPPQLYVSDDIRKGLTKDKLVDRTGTNYLFTEVNGYSGELLGDTFKGRINGTDVTVLVEVNAGKTALLFAEADIINFEELSRALNKGKRRAENATLVFDYLVTSPTGLISNPSVPLPLEVLIAAAIPDLGAPSLSATGVIGEAGARDDLKIIIPAHSGANRILPGDDIVVSMGGFKFPATPVPAGEENRQFSLIMKFREIYLEWERASGGRNEVVSTAFSYTIMRGDLEVGTSTELSADFNLFMIAGTPDLDSQLPGTPHPQMWRPTLMSDSGNPNYITETEMNAKLDATLWVAGFDVNDQPIYAIGDHLIVNYDNEVVVDEDIDPADLDTDGFFSFTLDGEVIFNHGLGPKRLDASVTRVVAGGVRNTSYMDYSTVVVANVEELPPRPGAGTYTPATGDPDFSTGDIYTVIWLREHGLTVTISDYGMVEHDIVKVYGTQWKNFEHADGETENLPIADFMVPWPIEEKDLGGSVVIPLPVNEILKSNAQAHLHLTVTVTRDGKESPPNQDTPHIKISSRGA